MKALTLWRPWPTAILRLVDRKPIENRPWPPPRTIRGRWLALHAGKTYQRAAFEGAPADDDAPTGIVGMVRVRGLVQDHGDVFIVNEYAHGEIPESRRRATRAEEIHFRRWYTGPFAWWLVTPYPLREPVPCRGRQGLWTVPEDVANRVEYQTTGMAHDRLVARYNALAEEDAPEVFERLLEQIAVLEAGLLSHPGRPSGGAS